MMIPTDQAASTFQGLGIEKITKKTKQLLRNTNERCAKAEKALNETVMAVGSRTKVLDAISTLCESEQTVTRQRIKEISGLTVHIVDDHLDRLVSDGVLSRLVAGVYALVQQYPKSRAISHTLLPDGTSNIEIGEDVLILTPKERRMLGKLLFSDAVEHTNLQGAQDFNVLVSEMTTCMLLLRRCQVFEEALGRQLGLAVDPATKGLSDRVAAIAERLVEGTYRGSNKA